MVKLVSGRFFDGKIIFENKKIELTAEKVGRGKRNEGKNRN